MIWISGMSSSGKTTLCNAIWRMLKTRVPELVVLDGDAVRTAFGNDLGYREEDRTTQIRRIQNIAKLLSEQNLVVLVAALYSHPTLLEWNRSNLPGYFEVYLEASLDTVRRRDTKSLYDQAASGRIVNVVGVDIPWRPPESPDMVITADNNESPDVLARRVIAAIPRLTRAMETA